VPRVNCVVNPSQHVCVATEIERFVFVVFVVPLRRAIQYGRCASFLSASRLFGVKQKAIDPEMAFLHNVAVLKRKTVNRNKCYIVHYELTVYLLPVSSCFSLISFSGSSRSFFATKCCDLRLKNGRNDPRI
jgi:hypothetical protein